MPTRPPGPVPRLLLVDPDPAARRVIRAALERSGTAGDVMETADPEAAVALARHCAALLVAVAPGDDGLIRRLRAAGAGGHIVAALSQGSVTAAVAAMRDGANDVVLKPLNADDVATRLRQALAAPAALAPPAAAGPHGDFHGFIGSSRAMQAVYARIARVAASAASVFVTGESGTGKELAAAAVHALSPRATGPFIALNCSALPRDLLEGEMFGHARGAFTGAHEARAGAAEAAHGGTLFLDEIGEMDLALQAKLLRFLQMGTVRRIGESTERPVDVRIVCATNRDPAADVAAGRLRADLYYRLNVLPVHLPPLRARGDDITRLAEAFLARFAAEEQSAPPRLTAEMVAELRGRPWPGNVRELQNVIRRAVVLGETEPLAAADAPGISGRIEPFAAAEQRIIEAALAAFDGHIAKAAAALEISPSTIYRKKIAWDRPARVA